MARRGVLDAVVELDPGHARARRVAWSASARAVRRPRLADAAARGRRGARVADVGDPQRRRARGSTSRACPGSVSGSSSSTTTKVVGSWRGVLPARPRRSASSSSSTCAGIGTNAGDPEAQLRRGRGSSSSQRSRSELQPAAAGRTPSPRIRFMGLQPRTGWVFHSRWSRPDAGPYPSPMSPDAHLSLVRGAGARRLRVGAGRRSGAAQGPPPLRRRPRRRRLGEAHAHHARRHRRSARWAPRPSSRTCPTRCARRPAATAGTSARCSPTPTPKASHDGRPHRPRERRHLAVGPGRRLRRRRRRPRRPCSTACCSTSRPSCSTPPRTRSARPARSPRWPRAPRSRPGRTSGSTRSGAACAGFRQARPTGPWSRRRPSSRRELGCRALVVDGTAVHDLGASDVQELGYVLAARRALPARARGRRGRPSTTPPGWSSSGSPPATSSS